MNSAPSSPAVRPASTSVFWLIRTSEAFSDLVDDVLAALGAASVKRLGAEYYWIKTSVAPNLREIPAGIFVRWNLPLEHTWPVNPQKTEGFIEKAAQALLAKFGSRKLQAIFVGLLNPGSPDRYYKSLASNLRGRMLQVFPRFAVEAPEEQQPDAPTLFCMLGREGLFCGVQSPQASNGFFPGGSKYISTSSQETVSRAGAKIAEALHYLGLHRRPLPEQAHWLELGACPGGMTAELLKRNFRVTAVDIAPLDRRLASHPNLTFILSDAGRFSPDGRAGFDALLCDINGDPRASMREVVRLSRHLRRGGVIVFTLKLPLVQSLKDHLRLVESILDQAASASLKLVARTHLTYNRHEFTLFLSRDSAPPTP